MELQEVIRRRAMVRSFSPDPVDPATLERILLGALRSPTAGNSRGTAWVVLEGPDQTSGYFDATVDEEWRQSSRRWSGLRRAPVILLAYASAERYVARYREPDKAVSGLGDGPERWPVP
jgi:nitroreductase